MENTSRRRQLLRSARNALREESRSCLFTFSRFRTVHFPSRTDRRFFLVSDSKIFPRRIFLAGKLSRIGKEMFSLAKRHLSRPMKFFAVHLQHGSALFCLSYNAHIHPYRFLMFRHSHALQSESTSISA